MPIGVDIEMGKAPVARPVPKSKRRRGQYRLPITVALCFLGLFLFFVGLAKHGNGRSTGRAAKAGGNAGAWAAAATLPRSDGQPRVFTFEVEAEYPHDVTAFTQGLQHDHVCDNEGRNNKPKEVLWESTGLNGKSSIREVDLSSGRVLRSKLLPRQDFGEGLTRHGDRLYQITWMSPKAYSYALTDFEDVQQLSTPLRDGWGITSDGKHLVVGDSSEKLTWLDPQAGLASVRQVAVQDGGRPVRWLNELEFVEGLIWANIWHTDCIAQIEPSSGKVMGWALLDGLRQRAQQAAAADAAAANRQEQPLDREAVLNGIAYDPQQQRLYLTGKWWPRVYRVRLRELDDMAARSALEQARQHCIVKPAG